MSNYVKSDGKIYNSMNKHLGTAKSDGKIYNPMNKHLGYVKPDGKIYNPMNKHVGNVSDILRLVKDSKNIKPNTLVAAYHFIIKKIL